MSGHEKMQKGTKTTYPRPDRRQRGSLRDELVLADDWDSGETNETIAAEFGIGKHEPDGDKQ